jgi:hypothetical protein
MTDNSKRTGAAIEAHYQFIAWLVPAIEKFPKRWGRRNARFGFWLDRKFDIR